MSVEHATQTEKTTCPECDGLVDESGSEHTCTECGAIVAWDIDLGSLDSESLSYRSAWVVETYRRDRPLFEARVDSIGHKPWIRTLLRFVVQHDGGERLQQRLKIINPYLMEDSDG